MGRVGGQVRVSRRQVNSCRASGGGGRKGPLASSPSHPQDSERFVRRPKRPSNQWARHQPRRYRVGNDVESTWGLLFGRLAPNCGQPWRPPPRRRLNEEDLAAPRPTSSPCADECMPQASSPASTAAGRVAPPVFVAARTLNIRPAGILPVWRQDRPRSYSRLFRDVEWMPPTRVATAV